MVCVGRVGMSMQATYRLWRRGAGELDVGTATALREWKARRANATRHRGGCVLGWVVLVELGCGALSLVPSLCGHAQFRFLGQNQKFCHVCQV